MIINTKNPKRFEKNQLVSGSDPQAYKQYRTSWTVSVQFGKGNYISDRDHHGQSVDAEIAAWDKDGKWYYFSDQNDNVKGWMKTDDVADFMAMIKAKES